MLKDGKTMLEQILTDAQHFLGATDPHSPARLRDSLLAKGEIAGYTRFPTPQPLVCVDGALATHQTDVLVWVAAAASDSESTSTARSVAVAPVSTSAERLSSAAMALCELQAARSAAKVHEAAWMDGGLATPLISVATALSLPEQETSQAVCRLLDRMNAQELVEDYVALAQAGRIRALPKQDTAKSYGELWSDAADVSPAVATWVRSHSDHAIVRRVLRPGERTHPRRADEALRARIKRVSTVPFAAQMWVESLAPLFEMWAETVNAWVVYGIPRNGTGRPIKLEITVAGDDDPAPYADHLLGVVDSQIRGAQIVEALPQYLVDRLVKQEASTAIIDLMGLASRHLGNTHPEAVNHYRS